MRTLLFKTPPVPVGGDDVVVALVDVDGVEPFTLFVENLDLRVALTTVVMFRSKNANLTFTALAPGSAGNGITVGFTAAANQSFSVGVVGDAITVNLECGADGSPSSEKNLARNVMDALNADSAASALVTTRLAPGSDGSGQVDRAVAATSLAGGADAVALTSVEVAVSSAPPAETQASEWVVNTQAGASFGALAAGATKAYEFSTSKTGPAGAGATEIAVVRGLRVRATKGASETSVVASAVAKKRSL